MLALLQSRGRDLSHSFSLQWRLLRWTELLTQRRVIERAWWRLTFWRVAVVAASRVSLTPQCAVSRPAARARTRGKVGRAGRERGLRRCRAGCCARSRTRLNVPATSPVTGRLWLAGGPCWLPTARSGSDPAAVHVHVAAPATSRSSHLRHPATATILVDVCQLQRGAPATSIKLQATQRRRVR